MRGVGEGGGGRVRADIRGGLRAESVPASGRGERKRREETEGTKDECWMGL